MAACAAQWGPHLSAQALLIECRSRGIRLRAEGDELVIKGKLDAELIQRIREHKQDLMALFRTEPDGLCSECDGTDFRLIGGLWWCCQCDPFEAVELTELDKLQPDEARQVLAIRSAFDASLIEAPPEPVDIGKTAYGAALVALYGREQ